MHRILLSVFSFLHLYYGYKNLEPCKVFVNKNDNLALFQNSATDQQTYLQILIPATYTDGLKINFQQLDASWLDFYFDQKSNTWKTASTQYKLTRSYD